MADQAPKTVEGLRYKGSADRRVITKAQWAKAKVDDQEKDVVWDSENDFTVLKSDLSKKAIALLEKDTDGFKTVNVEA